MLFSKSNPIYLIAEVGSNHEGNFKTARRLFKECIKSKADCIKIQVYTPDNLVSKKYDPKRFKHFSKLKLKISDYIKLAKICKKSGKDFSASIWDKNLIKPFKNYVKFYKIGSGDLTNYEIINEILKTGKPLVISVGLSNFNDIKNVLNFIFEKNKNYILKKKISILHCNTSYPTPPKDSRLYLINKIKKKFKVQTGFSDHTIGIKTMIKAIEFGAQIIEKHYSLNPERKTFRDHQISCTNKDISKFFEKIKKINKKKRYKIKTKMQDKFISSSEKKQNNLYSFRRSLYLKKDIKKGEKISLKKLTSLRPLEGICASNFFKIIGKKVNQNIKSGSVLKKSYFKD